MQQVLVTRCSILLKIFNIQLADISFHSSSFRWLGENNNCMFFKHGDFTTATSCSVDTHDWYYIGDAPPQDFPNEQLVLCSTECPTANGQKYVSEFGKVRKALTVTIL